MTCTTPDEATPIETSSESSSGSPAGPGRRWVALVLVVFVVALGVRVPHLAAPPDSFHTMRQYHGQLLTRWVYDEMTGRADDPAGPRVDLDDTVVLEPPVGPAISAVGFAVFGGESWWLPRLVGVGAWLAGGWMLMQLTSVLAASRRAGLAAAVFFLLVPFGISLSRSVQPDGLMIAAMIGAWWAAVLASKSPTRSRLIAVGIATALAVLLKAGAGLLILPVVVALLLPRCGWSKLWRQPLLLVTTLAALGPSVLYYGVSIAVGAPLRGQFTSSFVPSMIVDPAFWASWFRMIVSVVGLLGVCAFVVVLSVLSTGRLRQFLVGASLGFVLLGLTFSYRSATHDYYAAPMLPLVGVTVGVLLDSCWKWLRTKRVGPRSALLAVSLGLALVVATSGRAPTWAPTGTDEERAAIRQVSEHLPGGVRVLMVDGDYGNQMRYDSGLLGETWPTQADVAHERLIGRRSPDAADRLARMRSEGVQFLVSTVPIERFRDDSIEELAAQVAGCDVVERVGDVSVVDLMECAPAS